MNKNNRTTFIIGQTDSLEIAESISCLVSDHYWSRSEEVLRRQIAGLAAAGESCAALLCSALLWFWHTWNSSAINGWHYNVLSFFFYSTTSTFQSLLKFRKHKYMNTNLNSIFWPVQFIFTSFDFVSSPSTAFQFWRTQSVGDELSHLWLY